MGYSFELLANRSPYTGVEPTIVHVTPKDTNLREEMYTHSDDEFIYILKGTIKLAYDDDEYIMEQGDTAYFTGTKRSEEHTSELQSRFEIVCRILIEQKSNDWMMTG